MRIDRLDLRAYGPFTGRVLDFSDTTAGLHVVYGPNEAGKSSALRALGAALFGIHGQTPDDFLHEYSALRLGMTIRNARGDRLSFVRHKATRNPLWDERDEKPIADDSLRPFLATLDAEEFARVFGLDHERLRRGGAELLAAAEGADAAIVGAALGVTQLRDVREEIAKEAAALFTPNARSRIIPRSIDEWKRIQKEVRERSLSESRWHEAQREAERTARERDAAAEREKTLRARHAELDFALRNRPRVARLTDVRAKLAELAHVPDLDEAFAERRQKADDARREAAVLSAQNLQDEKAAREALASLPSDFAFLDSEVELHRLRDLSIETAKGERDRERRRAERNAAAAERDRMARALGLAVPLEPAVIQELRLALEGRERCQKLLEERARITAALTEVRRRIRDLERDRGACEERLGIATDETGYAPLERALKEARKLGDVDTAAAELQREREALDREVAAGVSRLSGWSGAAEDLSTRPVPGAQELEEFRRRFEEVDEDLRQARRRTTDLREQRAGIDGRIERLATTGGAVDVEDLARARAQRDARWRLVRRAWMDGEDVTVEARALDSDRPLAESYERSVSESDDVADRLRSGSQHAAELAEARRQCEDADRQLELQARVAADTEERRRRLWEEWRAAWAPSGFEIGSPAAMQDLLAGRATVIERLQRGRESAARLDALEKKTGAARAALASALDLAGIPPGDAPRDGAFSRLLARAEEQYAVLTRRAEKRRIDENDRDRLTRELGAARDVEKDLDEQWEAWTAAFAVVTRGIPQREGDPPEAVTHTLGRIDGLMQRNKEVEDLEGRIAKIDRDGEDLAASLQAFLAAHALERLEEESAVTVNRLLAIVQQRKEERQTHAQAESGLRAIEERRRRTEAAVAVAERTLGDLAREAGAPSVDALPELIRLANAKRQLRRERDQTEEDLLREGCSVEDAEARVAALAGVDLEAELPPAKRALDEATEDAAAKRDAATRAHAAFQALESETGAAGHAAGAAAVAASLRAEIERYVRLTLASHLLGTAVDRFRESHEAPMLGFASRRLATLTGGRYVRVETDLDEKGQPFFLVREGAGSAAKRVTQLSDGTRDQVHLALVLGSLEHRFQAGAEPMPLVLDDVLVHFDDDRSRAALETLAEFSKTTQVLLFTHHERIRDEARGCALVCAL